jgi:membrane-associated phospholipid phosphatase
LKPLRAFVAARLDTKAYLGLHLTVALIVAALSIWLLSAVWDAVLDNATMVRLDVVSDAWLHRRVTTDGFRLFLAITQCGSPLTMAVLGVCVAAVLWSVRARLLLICWVAAFAGGGLIDELFKAIVKRNRPDYHPAYDLRHSYSFPSGHAMGSTIGYGMLAYVLIMLWPPARRRRWPIIGVAVLIVGLVGFSRVYLGVHYPSDVLGGYAAGLAWVALCIAALRVRSHSSVPTEPDQSDGRR